MRDFRGERLLRGLAAPQSADRSRNVAQRCVSQRQVRERGPAQDTSSVMLGIDGVMVTEAEREPDGRLSDRHAAASIARQADWAASTACEYTTSA